MSRSGDNWRDLPIALRVTLTALITVTGVLAVSVGLMVWSPPVAWRDAEIRLLQDKVHELQLTELQLREHNRAMRSWQRAKEQWEQEKAAEAASRRAAAVWRESLMTRLDDLEGACLGRANR